MMTICDRIAATFLIFLDPDSHSQRAFQTKPGSFGLSVSGLPASPAVFLLLFPYSWPKSLAMQQVPHSPPPLSARAAPKERSRRELFLLTDKA